MIEPRQLEMVALVGLAAGTLGGMLGIGGSVIMIPGLVALFSKDESGSLHVFQAAAMTVNVAVAGPAAVRHARAGALRMDMLRWMLPTALVCIVAGVLLASRMPTDVIRRLFAGFLVMVVLREIGKIIGHRREVHEEMVRVRPGHAGLVGALMGAVAGILGVGGGVLAVPLAQTLCRVKLREAIAASSAVMCVTAAIGASVKMMTLGELGFRASDAMVYALLLAPGAVLGGWVGASLSHRLPVRVVRGVLVVTLMLAAWRMASG